MIYEAILIPPVACFDVLISSSSMMRDVLREEKHRVAVEMAIDFCEMRAGATNGSANVYTIIYLYK